VRHADLSATSARSTATASSSRARFRRATVTPRTGAEGGRRLAQPYLDRAAYDESSSG
jgi:hypothetical protein